MTTRSCLVGVFACAVAFAGCSGSRSPVRPTEMTASPASASVVAAGGGSAGVSASAAGGPFELNHGLAGIRATTAAFHDVNAAVAAGYASPAGRPCDASPDGIMGIHAPNPALIANPALDPATPEVLLYLPQADGGFRLIGVEYLVPVLLRDSATGTVQPWFQQAPWPDTWQVVNVRPSVLGQEFNGPMPGHVPGMPWHWDLHAWIWAPNPSGTFAQWNPSLSCPS